MATWKHATCPACKQHVSFESVGVQHWPVEICRKYGIPTSVTLWHCSHCKTTVSGESLLLSGEAYVQTAPLSHPPRHSSG